MKLTKLRDVEAALARPAPGTRLFLLHGPDTALAVELAARLAVALGTGVERVDLDGAALRNDPGRLADEAASLSLFGDVRFIRVVGAGEESLAAFTALLTAERAGNVVVALAPGVRSTARIVKLANESPMAIAFACYEPTAADLERVVTGLAQERGLRATLPVARRLIAAAGGDRAVIAREIDKFALYLDAAPDRVRDLDDAALDALGADVGDAEAARLVDAVIGGHPDALGGELDRLMEANGSPIPWLRQLARRLLTLAEMRSELDDGDALDAVLRRHRVFFREEQTYAAALRRWSSPLLAQALDRVRAAERGVMASGNAGTVVASQALTDLTRAIGRRG